MMTTAGWISAMEDQFRTARADMSSRAASICILAASAFAFASPVPVAAFFALYLVTELAGQFLYRSMARGTNVIAALGLHGTAFFGAIATTGIAVLLFKSGNHTVIPAAVAALIAALIHCIIVRSVCLSYGLATAVPILSGLVYFATESLGGAKAWPELMVGAVIPAISLAYILRAFARSHQVIYGMRLAKATSTAKDAFLASVSHEIRTPLNAVSAISELLETTDGDGEFRSQTRLLRHSALELKEIVDDVLDQASLGAGKLELKITPVILREEIDAAIQSFRDAESIGGSPLRLVVASDVPQRVQMDASRFRQLIGILLKNASSENGALDVTISAASREEAKVLLTVAIDCAAAIARAADFESLFRQHSRLSLSQSAVEGTGVGFSTARQLSRLMGGDVAIIQNGDRSTITLTILIAAAQNELPDAMPALVATSASTSPPSPISPSIQRVLVVDDVASNRYVVKAFLKPLGIALTDAKDGLDCLAKLDAGVFDLVILDLNMPRLGGRETLMRLPKNGDGRTTTPVIVLTANAASETRGSCLQLGASGYLSKPVTKAALFEEIRSALEFVPRDSAA